MWTNLFPSLPSLQPLRVRGCILTLVERMDEEFTKIMQNTDPHSQGEPEKAWASVGGKVQGLKSRIVLKSVWEASPSLLQHSHHRASLRYWTPLPQLVIQ